MQDEGVGVAVQFNLEAELSMTVTVITLAISGAALRSAYQLLAHRTGTSYAWCRRWALIASVAALAWYGFEVSIPLERELPILLAIAAIDCWLASCVSRPGPTLPTALARRRARTA